MSTGTKTPCSLCNLVLNSYEQYVAHIAGKAHKRKQEQSGGNTSTQLLPPVPVKIVRPNTYIRFVSSQNNNTAASGESQNQNGDSGDNRVANGSAAAAAVTATANMVVDPQNGAFCSTCVVKLTSQALADMHYAGAKHKRAVAFAASGTVPETQEPTATGTKRKLEGICEVCNVPLATKAVSDAHYAGAKHNKKMKLSQDIKTIVSNQSWTTYPGSNKTALSAIEKVQAGTLFYCNYCKVTVNSQMQMDAHQQGAKHKAAVTGVVLKKKIFKPRQQQEMIRPQEPSRVFINQQEPSRVFINQQEPNRTFMNPQEPNRTFMNPQELNRPQEQSRYGNQDHFQPDHFQQGQYQLGGHYQQGGHFQQGNFGNPTGHMQYRPGVPVAYQSSYY